MTDNLIDLTMLLKKNEPEGIKVLKSIPPQTADTIINFMLEITLMEVRVGLGLVEIDDDDDEVDLKIYQKIDDLYEEAAGGCYFCSHSIDPNGIEFNANAMVCLPCRMKLANFVQALGIDPGRVFLGMGHRKVQKSRIKIK